MFPLDDDFLLVLKFFVLFTCFFFWIRLGVRALMRQHNLGSYHRRHAPYARDED